MTAIITDTYKRLVLEDMVADIADSDNYYYIAIGRSEDWDSADAAPTPVNGIREQRNFRQSMQSLKLVSDWSYVVPRYNWSSGTVYSAFDDNVQGHPANSYYVLTEDNNVYVCLRQGKTASGLAQASSVKPAGVTADAFATADGYVWKFLYAVGASDASKYMSANFMPVKFQGAVDSDSPVNDIQQKDIQDAAVPGQIVGVQVQAAGTGYTSTPTVTIVGDGTGASASATVAAGAITKITMDEDSAGELQFGSGYTQADVVISGGGGTGGVARAVFGQDGGFGFDPRTDLRASALMFNAKPDGTEGGDFIIGNDFRQIALIRNPKKPVTDSDFTDITGTALKSLQLASVAQPFTRDNIISGSTSSATAFIDDVDSDTIWYHQTEETGYGSFVEGELITETNGAGSGTLEAGGADSDSDAYVWGDVNPASGEILYIDNRTAISRSSSQTEDLKLIIQL